MKIFLLHLSDFHIKATDEINDLSSGICAAVQDIAADCDHAIAVVTGDLTATGCSVEFIKVNALFSGIQKAFINPAIGKDISFITVPGNHDCNLRNISPTRTDIIKHVIENQNNINLINESAAIQTDYFDFTHQIHDDWNTNKFIKTKIISFGDYHVAFNCYNSAWMYCLGQKQGSLYFPVECAISNLDKVTSNLTLSLLHHPLDWFNSENARSVCKYLTKTSDIVLTGHIHQMGKRLVDDLDDKLTLYIEGGKIQDKNDADNCGFISLIIDTCSLNHRLLLYKWNSNHFKLIHDNYLNQRRLKGIGRTVMNDYFIKDSFKDFLTSLDAPIFHRSKTGVLKLPEVYIFPKLLELNEKNQEIDSVRQYFDSTNFVPSANGQKYFIIGENVSGKTSLCKSLFIKYHNNGYIPLYVKGKEIKHSSIESFDKEAATCFEAQYDLNDGKDFQTLDFNKVVLFIDDFEKSRLPSEQMGSLLEKINAKYLNVFIFANTVFEFDDLFVANKQLILSLANYKRMALLQFGFDLRSQLIHRWNLISDEKLTTEQQLRKDDEYEIKMNSLIRDGNIVSAFPIFLLTILLAIETDNTKSLEQSSTSHYYHYIITSALKNLKLSQGDSDSYQTFLTELAATLFRERKRVISQQELSEFHKKFVTFHRISVYSPRVYDFDQIIENLLISALIEGHEGNYSFKQAFGYYFFVGKFLSENRNSGPIKEKILNLIKLLQYDEYSNILMFVVHYTKEDYILQALIDQAKSIFSNYAPIKFEDDTTKISGLLEEIPALILKRSEIQEYRKQKLLEKDEANPPLIQTPAFKDKEIPEEKDETPEAFKFIANISIASTLMDLMGQILINYRSIPGDQQDEIAVEIYLLGLRCLSGMFELLESNSNKIIDNIANRIISTGTAIDEKSIQKQAKQNLFYLYSVLSYVLIKTVSNSIGSDTLSEVTIAVPRKYPYLSVALIDISIKLDHYNYFPLGELTNVLKEVTIPRNPAPSTFINNRENLKPHVKSSRTFPFLILRQLVEEYLYKFPTEYRDRQRICAMFGIEMSIPRLITQTSEETTKQNE